MAAVSSSDILIHVDGTKGICVTEDRDFCFPSLLQFNSRKRHSGYCVKVYGKITNKIWYGIDGLCDDGIETACATRNIWELQGSSKLC